MLCCIFVYVILFIFYNFSIVFNLNSVAISVYCNRVSQMVIEDLVGFKILLCVWYFLVFLKDSCKT